MAPKWCHHGAMDLQPYIDQIQDQLAVAAAASGEAGRAVADRLVVSLDLAARLTLQDALVAATAEITCELAPGSVEVRLRGRDVGFVVTEPAASSAGGDAGAVGDWPSEPAPPPV